MYIACMQLILILLQLTMMASCAQELIIGGASYGLVKLDETIVVN